MLVTKADIATLAGLVADLADVLSHRYPEDDQIEALAANAKLFAMVKVSQAQREAGQ